MNFDTDKPLTLPQAVQGLRYRINGMVPGQGTVIPYQGIKMLLDGIESAWKERDDAKAELEVLKAKRGPGRPPKEA